EEADQVKQVPERVIDRRRCQQQNVPRTAEQQPAQHGRAGWSVGGAIVVRLIDDDELVLVERALQMFFARLWALSVPKLDVVGKLFVRDALDGQIELPAGDELLPRGVAKLSRTDEQSALPARMIKANDFAGDEGLSQPHFVRHQRAAASFQQAQCSCD